MRHGLYWVLLLSAICARSAMAAEHYTITDLNALAPLGTMKITRSEPTGINSTSTVVGFAHGKDGTHPFIYSDGVMQDLREVLLKKTPPKHCDVVGVPKVVTEAGDVLGEVRCYYLPYWFMQSWTQVFLYRDGTVTFLNGPGSVAGVDPEGVLLVNPSCNNSGCWPSLVHRVRVDPDGSQQDLGELIPVNNATSINRSGQIVGWSWWHEYESQAYLWSKEKRQLLPFDGGRLYINDTGEIVGLIHDHAWLYSQGAKRDLGTLGGHQSRPEAINGKGQVVGYSLTRGSLLRDGGAHAFLWENGVMKDLNDLVVGPLKQFVTLDVAHGINDSDVVIASGRDSRQVGFYEGSRAYLLTPAPENR